MSAKVKYTPAELADAVESYFNSIKRTAAATELVPTGETARNGSPKMALEPILDGDGKPVMVEKWIVPPTITSLCLFLNISKMTWSEYSRRKGYSEICEHAKEVCREYLERELLTRDRVDGVKFALQFAHGYGIKDGEKNGASADAQNAPVKSSKMSMAELREVLELIRNGGADDGEEENDEN